MSHFSVPRPQNTSLPCHGNPTPPNSPRETAERFREHKYRPGCGPEPALVSARSRQPAVCNTLPKPSCSPAGNLPEKQRWQHDLEGKKKKKRGKKGEMSNLASSGLGSPPAKLKEQPAPFRQLQSPERATPGAAVWMRQDRLYAGWRVTSQEQAEKR